jgi:hypothetical protein
MRRGFQTIPRATFLMILIAGSPLVEAGAAEPRVLKA